MKIDNPINDPPFDAESNASGVCWAAVIGGAFVTASLALILIILGVGLGLSSISPWSGAGASATAIGLSTIVWLIATQIIASGLGGYLAGRLRLKWPTVHVDEVYFRDTAHGFLVWAVSVVITAALLGSAVTSIVGSGAKLAATTAAAGAVAVTAGSGEGTAGGYLTDTLLRPNQVPANAAPEAKLEIGRILAEALRHGTLPDADRAYAARVIAAQTGLSQAEAEKRVDAVYAQGKRVAADAELAARNAADKARKAAAKASLWMFIALLTGAFSASLAATIGGRQRDRVARNVGE